MPNVATFEHDDLPPAFTWQAIAYMRQIWPSIFTGGLTWLTEPYPAQLRPWHAVVHEGEVLVAYASVIRLTIEHQGRDHAVDGVGNVLTASPYRGRGHGRQVVDAVNARLDAGDADAGVLFCAPHLEPFYAPAGWLPCPGGTTVGSGAESYSDLRMARLLSDQARADPPALLDQPMRVEWAW